MTTLLEFSGRVRRDGLDIRMTQDGVWIYRDWGDVKEVIVSGAGMVEALHALNRWEEEHARI